MMAISRRSLLAGGLMLAVPPKRDDFFDGQTIYAAGREFALTDILAPSESSLSGGPEPGALFAHQALARILASGRIVGASQLSVDRWGRTYGALRFRRSTGAESTLQEALLDAGAARVFPQSALNALLDRYFAAEERARANRRGIWAHSEFAIRDAVDLRRAHGLQIYQGFLKSVAEKRGRLFFNFGEDFRTDLTGVVTKGVFRRWSQKVPLEAYAEMHVEMRGFVDQINGPSIELRHERQLRLLR